MARAQKVSYFAMQIPNRPGEAGRILSGLAKAGVNLLAFTGFPNGRNSQVDFIPANPTTFSRGRARHETQAAWQEDRRFSSAAAISAAPSPR